MSQNVIQANYEALERILREFERCAEDSEKMHQRLKAGMDQLVIRRWEGEGSRAFFKEMENEVLPAFTRLTDALSACQQTTGQVISTFQRAEEEAAALFKQDGSGTQSGVGGPEGDGTVIGPATPGSSGPAGPGIWSNISKADWDWWRNEIKSFGDGTGSFSDLIDESSKTIKLTDDMKGFGKWLKGIGLGLNILADEDFTTDPARAIAGELGKWGLKEVLKNVAIPALVGVGLGAIGITAAPVVAAAVGVTLFVVNVGDIAPPLLNIAGKISNHFGANSIGNFCEDWSQKLNYMEPVDNALEWVSEKTYDIHRFTTQTAPQWLGNQAANFIGSLFQGAPQAAY